VFVTSWKKLLPLNDSACFASDCCKIICKSAPDTTPFVKQKKCQKKRKKIFCFVGRRVRLLDDWTSCPPINSIEPPGKEIKVSFYLSVETESVEKRSSLL
jgi:hypothetical protein